MEDAKGQGKKKSLRQTGPEPRVVRVAFNPGPDAEDRLRRLFTLLVKCATTDQRPRP